VAKRRYPKPEAISGIVKLAIAGLVLTLTLPAMAGTLKGKITTKTQKKIPRRVAQRYPGKHTQPAKPMEPVPAVVVIMGKIKGFPPPKVTKPLKMAQQDYSFKPSLLVVPVNSNVEFPNFDPEFHNVFSYSKTKRFDLGRYHQGESKSVHFTKPGIGKIYCEIHEWMRAAVVVVENPFYAVADSQGNYEIKGIPAGTYQVLVWKMDHKRSIQEIVVPATGVLEKDFALPEKESKKTDD